MEHNLLPEPGHIDEAQMAHEYAAVLTQVASARQPLVVRRNGQDLVAVIPLEHLHLLQELLLWQATEQRAAEIDWAQLVKTNQPPPAWFEDDDNPCASAEAPTS